MRRAEWLVAGVLLLAAAGAGGQALPPSMEGAATVLPASARAELAQRQTRLARLPPARRADLATRMAAWDARPLAERRAARDAAAAWRAMPAAERARVRIAAAAFARLPAAEQEALRARFDALDESERIGWRLGPALGGDYPHLHALVSQVPAHQRAPLLAALRVLPEEARRDLAVLAQRTPPQGRDELRIALLATAPAARANWLRRQVDP